MNEPELTQQRLKDISTRWSEVRDVNRFVLRYTDAMSRLLNMILKDEDASRDVLQAFLLRIIERGFRDDLPKGGRFRDYLTKSLRNAAIDYFRTFRPTQLSEEALHQLESRWDSADEQWKQSWTRCLVDRAWQQLEHFQYETKNCHYFDVLRIGVEHPDSDSNRCAELLAEITGHEVSPESYRQQLALARRRFAELLRSEVRETLDAPSEEVIAEEIAALGLKKFVRADD
ncbi:MAG: hypothetical protein AAGJ83_03325 [Planctomycetota bacterium]